MVLVYHYTNEAGLDAIYKTNVIKASRGAYGHGVYFTEFDPTMPREQIASNNWGTSDLTKTRFWYKFNTEDYPAITQVGTGRNIWLHSGDMKLHENSRLKLYHYTDLTGMEAIRSSGVIRKHQPKDASKKEAVYFTELRPRHSLDRKTRMRKVFGSTARDETLYGKTKYWFWFRVEDLPGVRKQRAAHGGYEWLLEADVDIKKGRR